MGIRTFMCTVCKRVDIWTSRNAEYRLCDECIEETLLKEGAPRASK